MPNHIVNRLTIKGDTDKITEVLNFIKGEPFNDGSPRYMDFNTIIPMPKELGIGSSSLGDAGVNYLMAKRNRYMPSKIEDAAISRFDRLNEQQKQNALALGRQYLRNIANYDFENWYEWSIANWGTKWNAYNQELISLNCICFNTAWSNVVCLIEKLSQRFPKIEFLYKWSDENASYNCGFSTIINGNANTVLFEGGSKEAYELYFELHPGREAYYELIGENYQHKEEEE